MDKEKAIKITISLLKLGISQAQIAKELQLNRSTVNKVIRGRARSKRIDDYINSLIEKQRGDKK